VLMLSTLPRSLSIISFLSIIPRPPTSPLFPYTTLFRSRRVLPYRTGHEAGDLVVFHSLASFATCALLASAHVDTTVVTLQGIERSEEHTSELQSRGHLVCRLLLEKKKKNNYIQPS